MLTLITYEFAYTNLFTTLDKLGTVYIYQLPQLFDNVSCGSFIIKGSHLK